MSRPCSLPISITNPPSFSVYSTNVNAAAPSLRPLRLTPRPVFSLHAPGLPLLMLVFSNPTPSFMTAQSHEFPKHASRPLLIVDARIELLTQEQVLESASLVCSCASANPTSAAASATYAKATTNSAAPFSTGTATSATSTSSSSAGTTEAAASTGASTSAATSTVSNFTSASSVAEYTGAGSFLQPWMGAEAAVLAITIIGGLLAFL